ncbi:hypothetical protein ETB97_009400 [Aspergillus alliaceus]|uniref:NAD(P)-binding domain-containing protein n=1 Tax=Petromyces alliaceus TaxID=209559 RepID=A0A5N6G967_PETAA|nr:uncharacterized protein BDW43DRAFT_154110 [Aspergillus alliaceus]KAB8238205.1 hypothetical protein BDW43DRAFT_154110 [Aspergillus alliaceus]KAF5863765.1 hypothetical protein ETB97_009400 [Aspergillus burnettii]
MRIAIAGAGGLARYISDEFPKHGHEVVILTRSEKGYFRNRPNITQTVTDYSVSSLVAAIGDCEVLISVILSYTTDFIDAHLNLIKACQLSPKCKRFIPSEFGGNIEDYPDLPSFYWETRGPVRKALQEQKELEWTIVNNGWLVDYIVPRRNRYLSDVGEAFPIDVEEKRIVIPGTGKDLVDITSARDLAAALALLAKAPSWEPYVYVSGKKTCWNELAELVQRRYPQIQTVRRIGLGSILGTIQNSTDEMEVLLAYYQIFVPLGAGSLDPAKVEAQRRKYFSGLVFRSPEQLIDEAEAKPENVV